MLQFTVTSVLHSLQSFLCPIPIIAYAEWSVFHFCDVGKNGDVSRIFVPSPFPICISVTLL